MSTSRHKDINRLRSLDWASRAAVYNSFCKPLREGDILYNLDITNKWGEYLLVATRSVFTVDGIRLYYMLLLGLDKEGEEFKPNSVRISLSPDKLENLSYLKPIGRCSFSIVSQIQSTDINGELESEYKSIDFWKYNSKLDTRKPIRRKYDVGGELRIRNVSDNLK